MKKIIVGITGASGVIYGIRLLEILNKLKIETHLILTNSAKKVLKHETHYTEKKIISMATHHHDESDITASLASGSFKTDAMVIIPCSAKTLAGIEGEVEIVEYPKRSQKSKMKFLFGADTKINIIPDKILDTIYFSEIIPVLESDQKQMIIPVKIVIK